MALPIAAAAGAFARNAGKALLTRLAGSVQEQAKPGWSIFSWAIFGISFLGFILVLAVSSGTAGEHTGVNNPREPGSGQPIDCPPGEACVPEDIPPSTGNCAGIANTARAELGVTEQPPGSNSGPQVDLYTDNNPEFWCSDFVSWVLWQSGNRLDPNRIPSRVSYRSDRTAGREANVLNMQSYFSRYEIFLPPGSEVQAGDIVFYDFRRCGSVGDTHNGIVVSYNPDSRTYVSVEGNIADAVRSRTYNVSSSCIIGFGRLRNCQSPAAILDYFDVKVVRRSR